MKHVFLFACVACLHFACGSDRSPSAVPPPETSAIPPVARREVGAPPAAETTDTIAPGRPAPDTATQPGEVQAHKPAKDKAGADQKASYPEYYPAQAESAPPVFDAPPAAAGDNWIAAYGFTDVQKADSTLRFDIRYATTNNFTQAKIYDCPRCLLRPEAAAALLKAHRALQRQGLGLKLFDCYRPQPYQQRLWDKVPNPDYVTPPAQGSMHSRGAAVDLTIVDARGEELDMGTPFDFFGREAHYDYGRLPAKVLANRRLLRRTMMDAGFEGIRTEWWHFSFRGKSFSLSNFLWDCPGRH